MISVIQSSTFGRCYCDVLQSDCDTDPRSRGEVGEYSAAQYGGQYGGQREESPSLASDCQPGYNTLQVFVCSLEF